MARLDTHRTPLLFSSDAWVRLFRILIPVGLAAVATLLALFVAALVWSHPLWRMLSLVPSFVIFAVCALTLQASWSPYTAGANDNATGVGVVLDLAR